MSITVRATLCVLFVRVSVLGTKCIIIRCTKRIIVLGTKRIHERVAVYTTKRIAVLTTKRIVVNASLVNASAYASLC